MKYSEYKLCHISFYHNCIVLLAIYTPNIVIKQSFICSSITGLAIGSCGWQHIRYIYRLLIRSMLYYLVYSS